MRQASKIAILSAVLMLLTAGGHAQSLGDVAREQRQKQQAKAGQAPAKVVTNEDIPENPEASSDNGGSAQRSDSPASSLGGARKTAEQWRAEILRQKSSVASLQNQIDRLNSSIHFTGPTCVRNCVQHNQQQLNKQDEAKRWQDQLDEQKKKLDDLQEGARRDGYGGTVSDP